MARAFTSAAVATVASIAVCLFIEPLPAANALQGPGVDVTCGFGWAGSTIPSCDAAIRKWKSELETARSLFSRKEINAAEFKARRIEAEDRLDEFYTVRQILVKHGALPSRPANR
jgi:hypothetical protein